MDRSLVERARAGDHAAFSLLAEAASHHLYAVATLILRDPDRAQDAVQDALVSAWRDVRALRDPEAWDAWLHRLVVRKCYSEARRLSRRRSVDRAVDWKEPTIPDPSSSLADRDEIERGFRRLGVEERAILVLHFHVGMTASEAGAVLGVSEVAARSRLHRALRAMRAALDADARMNRFNAGRHA